VEKSKLTNGKVRSMLIIFFDIKEIVHKEFAPEVQTEMICTQLNEAIPFSD
jgi:hypothetical protein